MKSLSYTLRYVTLIVLFAWSYPLHLAIVYLCASLRRDAERQLRLSFPTVPPRLNLPRGDAPPDLSDKLASVRIH
jgi:hypothetical protein